MVLAWARGMILATAAWLIVLVLRIQFRCFAMLNASRFDEASKEDVDVHTALWLLTQAPNAWRSQSPPRPVLAAGQSTESALVMPAAVRVADCLDLFPSPDASDMDRPQIFLWLEWRNSTQPQIVAREDVFALAASAQCDLAVLDMQPLSLAQNIDTVLDFIVSAVRTLVARAPSTTRPPLVVLGGTSLTGTVAMLAAALRGPALANYLGGLLLFDPFVGWHTSRGSHARRVSFSLNNSADSNASMASVSSATSSCASPSAASGVAGVTHRALRDLSGSVKERARGVLPAQLRQWFPMVQWAGCRGRAPLCCVLDADSPWHTDQIEFLSRLHQRGDDVSATTFDRSSPRATDAQATFTDAMVVAESWLVDLCRGAAGQLTPQASSYSLSHASGAQSPQQHADGRAFFPIRGSAERRTQPMSMRRALFSSRDSLAELARVGSTDTGLDVRGGIRTIESMSVLDGDADA